MSLLRFFANEYAALKDHAFCPTGEGGGIDNSCSPTGGKGGSWENHAHETATAVSDSAAEFIYGMVRDVAESKGIRTLGASEREFKAALVTKAQEYFKEAYKPGGNRLLQGDYLYEFVAQVITPALNETVFSGRKMQGFGPRSITMRLNKIQQLPYGGIMKGAQEKWRQNEK